MSDADFDATMARIGRRLDSMTNRLDHMTLVNQHVLREQERLDDDHKVMQANHEKVSSSAKQLSEDLGVMQSNHAIMFKKLQEHDELMLLLYEKMQLNGIAFDGVFAELLDHLRDRVRHNRPDPEVTPD